MKNSLKLKLLFDLILTVVWVLLMIYSFTGSFWHEVLGIAIFIMFMIHIAVNYKWIVAVTKKLFTGKFSLSKVKYILDFLLIILISITTISGILIAKKILTVFNTDNFFFWTYIHAVSAYMSLAVISVHIGLHWKMIIEVFKKLLGIKQVKRVRSVVCKLFSVVIILLGVKSTSDYGFPDYMNDGTSSNLLDNVSTDEPSVIQTVTAATGLVQTDTKTSFTEIATVPDDGESLEDYLSRLICTACHNHCSLLSPRCSRGESQANTAEAYYKEYNAGNEESIVTFDSEDTSSEEESTTVKGKNSTGDKIDVGNILSIMGMYIGSTYYIVEFFERKKKL